MYRPTIADHEYFYCSFTHLPEAVNVDELPYTIHTPHSINHPTIFSRRSRQLPAPSPYPRVMSPTSSTASKTPSFWSTISTSSSLRRRRLLAGLRRLLRGISKRRRGARRSTSGLLRRGGLELRTTRKPSTLDFRCVGWEDDGGCFGARRSGLWVGVMDEEECGGAPKVEWTLGAGPNEDWFRGIM